MKFTFIFFILSLCYIATSSAQHTKDSSFCEPGVLGLPRAKGLEIKREIVRDYGIVSRPKDGSDTDRAEILRNRRWNLKLRLPIINKDAFKLAAGIQYFVEDFKFENPESLSSSFYQNIEDRSLKSLRGDLFIIKPTRGQKYYILRVGLGLNGDYNSERLGEEKNDFLRLSMTPLIGWKKNDYLSYAVGFSFGYNFGRRTIFPVFSYNRTFNQRWGVESILPVRAKLRYNTLDQKNFFYFNTELNGTNYALDLRGLRNELLFLDKSEIRFLISWEREIHDFLWFGLEAGYRENISFNLANSANINSNIIVENSLNGALILSASIFIVAPRKFMEKGIRNKK